MVRQSNTVMSLVNIPPVDTTKFWLRFIVNYLNSAVVHKPSSRHFGEWTIKVLLTRDFSFLIFMVYWSLLFMEFLEATMFASGRPKTKVGSKLLVSILQWEVHAVIHLLYIGVMLGLQKKAFLKIQFPRILFLGAFDCTVWELLKLVWRLPCIRKFSLKLLKSLPCLVDESLSQ